MDIVEKPWACWVCGKGESDHSDENCTYPSGQLGNIGGAELSLDGLRDVLREGAKKWNGAYMRPAERPAKVFVLFESGGEYSSWWQNVVGVFASEEAANAGIDHLMTQRTYGWQGNEWLPDIPAYTDREAFSIEEHDLWESASAMPPVEHYYPSQEQLDAHEARLAWNKDHCICRGPIQFGGGTGPGKCTLCGKAAGHVEIGETVAGVTHWSFSLAPIPPPT